MKKKHLRIVTLVSAWIIYYGTFGGLLSILYLPKIQIFLKSEPYIHGFMYVFFAHFVAGAFLCFWMASPIDKKIKMLRIKRKTFCVFLTRVLWVCSFHFMLTLTFFMTNAYFFISLTSLNTLTALMTVYGLITLMLTIYVRSNSFLNKKELMH